MKILGRKEVRQEKLPISKASSSSGACECLMAGRRTRCIHVIFQAARGVILG